jgi:two-component system alkaline phosphatase synthesis response regulator PhoP
LSAAKKVLVVENDEVVLILISHILTRHSYVVHTSSDAFEAGELLLREPYDAVLLDLKLVGGGVDLLRKIEQENPDLLRKIIVVTGALHEAEKIAHLPLHATVRKPFEVSSLVETVHRCAHSQ